MDITSRPTRGAWIETIASLAERATPPSRAPHGARGLKRLRFFTVIDRECRAPHGARGLKPFEQKPRHFGIQVAPHTGRVD